VNSKLTGIAILATLVPAPGGSAEPLSLFIDDECTGEWGCDDAGAGFL
jgi:hypothetical protein